MTAADLTKPWIAPFVLDKRSLAAFRIAVGGLLLADLAVRATDFAAMYGPTGFAPVEFVRSQLEPGEWSLHLLSGAGWFQAALMIAATAAAAALAAGYRTRAATVASWALVSSIHERLPPVLNAGDVMLRLMLFWGMFLPLGAVWSLDARRRRGEGRPPAPNFAGYAFASPATAALVVQMALIYLAAGVSKWNDRWLAGSALADVLAFQFYSQPLGRWLAQFPTLSQWSGWAVLVLEIVGPLALLAPATWGRLRLAVVGAFMLFHLSIAVTITVGMFAWIGLAAWLAMVPENAWNWLAVRLGGRRRAVVQDATPSSATGGHASAARSGFERSRAIVSGSLAMAALAVVTYWNLGALTGWKLPAPAHRAVRWAAAAGGLRQSWSLFSKPPRFDAIFVYQGRLRDGRLVDLYAGAPLGGDGVAGVAPHELPNHRWRKLYLHVLSPRRAAWRARLADFMCRRWNATHAGDDQAVRCDFYCLRRPTGGEDASDPAAFVRRSLATVVLDPQWDNFTEALRELEE